MSNNLSAQSVLISALNVLMQRRGNTTDAAEETAINLEIDEINAALRKLDQADLLRAALIVSDAAEGLERLVAAARIGPFDRYLVHGMEGGFNFNTHLHNGDPLTARTVRVPKGRPTTGEPPFDWRDSARDAMVLKGYQHDVEWSIPRILYLFEKFNGMGYRPIGVPTSYLWSFSDRYQKGKFVSDHHYEPEAVSGQCGAALMLGALKNTGAL